MVPALRLAVCVPLKETVVNPTALVAAVVHRHQLLINRDNAQNPVPRGSEC
jgi:hypothetical protein